MLDERRVKHMVKLAMYENKEGVEELKASEYYKKDYISFNMLWSIIWATIAYVIVVGLLAIVNVENILNNLSLRSMITIAGGVVIAYLVLLIVYIVISRRLYRKRHARAYHRVKRFKEGLGILEDMYQEDKTNG